MNWNYGDLPLKEYTTKTINLAEASSLEESEKYAGKPSKNSRNGTAAALGAATTLLIIFSLSLAAEFVSGNLTLVKTV